ncbi:MAG: 16S rRNA processing protein RimM [Deltaproteobacteria bacterium]|nr:16S rRNA processing protein RimM [Deltaproteobacteria bacterium]
MDNSHLLSIGKIVGVHGLKGVLKVFSYAESTTRYTSGMPLHLKDSQGNGFILKVVWAKSHSKTTLLFLEGIHNRDQAEQLVGSELFIDKSALEVLEEGTYYWTDLMGLSVYDLAGNYLGKLTAIVQTGSNDVYVVKKMEGATVTEVLIPALASVVRDVDLDQRVMRVHLPEGL